MIPHKRSAEFILAVLFVCSASFTSPAQSTQQSSVGPQTYFFLPLDYSAGGATPPKKKEALGTITAGWTYLWADQGNHYRSNLNGWFARPAFNIGHNLSLFADFTNYYGTNSKGSVNSHGFTFGIADSLLPKAKVKPSVFAEAGDVRASSAGAIVNQFAFNVGFNVAIPINKHVNLAITPAEYIFLYPQGDPRNDYNAKVGLSFPFGHR